MWLVVAGSDTICVSLDATILGSMATRLPRRLVVINLLVTVIGIVMGVLVFRVDHTGGVVVILASLVGPPGALLVAARYMTFPGRE